MAERSGTFVIQVDEIRAWIKMLRLTEGLLPCAMCRAHYREWRTAHPLEDFLGSRGELFRDRLREWLWGLHDAVNTKRSIPESAHLSLEQLHIYKSVTTRDIQESIHALLEVLNKAILHRQVNANYIGDWRKALTLLRKLINF